MSVPPLATDDPQDRILKVVEILGAYNAAGIPCNRRSAG